jgi:calcineurin-like phosphoesterase
LNVLFTGDVTGPEAVEHVAGRLPELRREHGVDLAIVNADNAALTGPPPHVCAGMTPELVGRLMDGGADLVTSGAHAFDGPGSEAALSMPRVLRPHNLPPGRPGRGRATLEVGGERVTVLNLTDAPQSFPEAAPLWESWLSAEREGTVVVHFVGLPHPARVFARAVDGEAAAVLGTYGHEATLRHRVLPGGTGLVPDVGMVGDAGGLAGFGPRFVAGLKGEDSSHLPPEEPTRTTVFDAVWLRLEGGACREIRRLGQEA